MTIPLSESRRALGAEELLGAVARDTVGEGELEVLGDELLDVRPLDVLGLLELDDAENLEMGQRLTISTQTYFEKREILRG